MGFFDRIFNRGNGMPAVNFFGYLDGGCYNEIDLSCISGHNAAYDRCSTLKTVINRNAMAMANGQWWITDKAGNDITDKYPVIRQRLISPNPIQSFAEFVMQMDVYRQLRGGFYVYFANPVGYGSDNASSWWVIDPQHVEVELSGSLYGCNSADEVVTRYWLNVGDWHRTEIPASQLLYVRDVNQNLCFCPTDINGATRLYSVRNSVNNLIIAEEALLGMNKSRGALGIRSNDAEDAAGHVPMTEKEQEDLQNKLGRRYGLGPEHWKVIVTDAKLRWQPMTMSIRDLQLIEGMTENIQLICNAFDYPFELLANTQNVTYANKNEAKKSMYEDSVIPISRIYAECFKRLLLAGADADFVIDFSHLSIFKTAEADKAKTYYQKAVAIREMYTLGVISREEARLELGYDETIEGKTLYAEQGAI